MYAHVYIMSSTNNLDKVNKPNVFITSLISGALAGTFVDVALFPIDTIKTRLQSHTGFLKSGGFNGLYRGIVPVLIGSAPTAALFFVTYEGIKVTIEPKWSQNYYCFLHMGAAALSEIVACLIRVPVEVSKQRKQAFSLDSNKLGLKLLYRGYWSTVLRDMPFSFVQFPLWEYFKRLWKLHINYSITPHESALCGAFAGSIAATVTTPLDVIKTRIMLANKGTLSSELAIRHVFTEVYTKHGLQGLYAGLGPRVVWITIGGFIFFGVYEKAKTITQQTFPTRIDSHT